MARFEYDFQKSNTNKKRHGIDFIEAQKLWEVTHVIVPAKNVVGESRYAILGTIDGKLCIAIITQRGESIRIISCHGADKKWGENL